MEAERILVEIRELVSELKKYESVKKIIMTTDGLPSEMNRTVFQLYCTKNPNWERSKINRFDPILIEVIEELGEEASPLCVKEIKILPGQEIRICDDYTIDVHWDF